MNELFIIEDRLSTKNNMNFDRKVTFYEEKSGKVEARIAPPPVT